MDVPMILIALIIIAVGFTAQAYIRSNLKHAGHIMDRDKDFMEYAEIFTFSPISPEQMKTALESVDWKAQTSFVLSGNTNLVRLNYGNKISASLTCVEQSEQKTVYQFQFTGWEVYHGVVEDDMIMNGLLTTVEKFFLHLDSNTQVTTKKLEVHTKRDFI